MGAPLPQQIGEQGPVIPAGQKGPQLALQKGTKPCPVLRIIQLGEHQGTP